MAASKGNDKDEQKQESGTRHHLAPAGWPPGFVRGKAGDAKRKPGKIREYCQEAFEDALLMGCDERQVREVFESIVKAIQNPYGGKKN